MTLVSVLMPYRGCEATLPAAITSVLDNNGLPHDALELLAIDDGSTDSAPERVHAMAARDPRIRAMCTTPDARGIVHALNLGLAHARAPWIARMDADDVARPGRLRAQLECITRDDRLGVVGTRVKGTPEHALGEGLALYIAWQNELITPHDHKRDLFVESPICHPSMFLRRAALEDVGGWHNTPWAEDYDLLLRMDARGWDMCKVPEVLLEWTHREGRSTFTHARYAMEQFVFARAHYLAPRLRAIHRAVWVWGAGPTGRRFARALESHGVRAAGFVDIDPRKIGRVARGVTIASPEVLDRTQHFVIAAVGARGARALIRAQLIARGFTELEHFVCAS